MMATFGPAEIVPVQSTVHVLPCVSVTLEATAPRLPFATPISVLPADAAVVTGTGMVCWVAPTVTLPVTCRKPAKTPPLR